MADPMGELESMFEKALWASRYAALLAVVSSIISALILFVVATLDVLYVAGQAFGYYSGRSKVSYDVFHNETVGHVIASVDDFLLATVLLIFGLGLYELFISKIEEAEKEENQSKILVIKDLDDLKDRLAKVVLMILIVTFFKNAIKMTFSNPLDMAYLGAGILCIGLALHFTKGKKE